MYAKHVCMYVCISQNLIGYGVFRKHPSLSKTQTSKNVELTVSKNCDPLFSIMTPVSPQLCSGKY